MKLGRKASSLRMRRDNDKACIDTSSARQRLAFCVFFLALRPRINWHVLLFLPRVSPCVVFLTMINPSILRPRVSRAKITSMLFYNVSPSCSVYRQFEGIAILNFSINGD